ncbi:MAG: redox-regulated ATPase YchF [Bacteroidales bacterium]|nr:redox-regulated ATPase YchF [Bacteroidales bacterium]
MALKVGIIGLTNTGKTTIFNCFSNTKAETSNYSFSTNKSNFGMAYVPDARLHKLSELVPTKKIVYTTMEFVDIPGLTKGASEGQGIGNSFLSDIRNVDAIIHVTRCFEDENLPHVEGSINPVRDIEILNLELQIKDLDSIEKRLDKVAKKLKAGDKEAKKEHEILTNYKDHLENFENARSIDIKEEDKKFVDDLFLLTNKPVMYVCNVDDDSANSGNKYSKEVEKYIKENDANADVLFIAAKLEADIAELESQEDRVEFLKDAGLTEPGINKLIQKAYELLNLSTFFTVGEQENRAWTIHAGIKAPDAAGVIHSDLKRGFIRAEVIAYNDFIALGSEHACKENGKLRLEGKEYIINEGDILHIRFNV